MMRPALPGFEHVLSLSQTAGAGFSLPSGIQILQFRRFRRFPVCVEAASTICAEGPAAFHTYYLYGPENLGKTHLLMAIGNEVAGRESGGNALYVHAGDFVRNMEGATAEAVNDVVLRLIEADFFLLDDVQAVSGNPTAQEKLYHIFNTLMERKKKAVFTGRERPDRLQDTESYLTSRLQWGMTAEIRPIDDSTTARIILKLGEDVGLVIPPGIVDFLLTRIPRDFSSIRSSVTQINQESLVQKKKVSLALAKAALNLP